MTRQLKYIKLDYVFNWEGLDKSSTNSKGNRFFVNQNLDKVSRTVVRNDSKKIEESRLCLKGLRQITRGSGECLSKVRKRIENFTGIRSLN